MVVESPTDIIHVKKYCIGILQVLVDLMLHSCRHCSICSFRFSHIMESDILHRNRNFPRINIVFHPLGVFCPYIRLERSDQSKYQIKVENLVCLHNEYFGLRLHERLDRLCSRIFTRWRSASKHSNISSHWLRILKP